MSYSVYPTIDEFCITKPDNFKFIMYLSSVHYLNVCILVIYVVYSFSPAVKDCFELLNLLIAFPKWTYI